MRHILIFSILCYSAHAQIYDVELLNQSPAYGNARNFAGVDWNGVSHVLSELDTKGETYSYVYHAKNDFRLFKKENEKFIELANLSKTKMESYSSLLHVYEDSKIINIFSWAYDGYNFVSLKKTVGQPSQPIRHISISNLNHCTLRDDPSIKSIVFEGSNQMKITKDPSEQYPETELLFEIRPDGVYRNGVWDRTVQDYEDSTVIDEKLKIDPNYEETLRQAREARLANDPQHQAELKKSRVVSPIQQSETKPESEPKPALTPLSPSIASAPIADTVARKSLNPWLMILLAVLMIPVGYLGLRYLRGKT